MKLFIWQGPQVSGAYGRDGFIAVAADTLAEARGFLEDYVHEAPSLAPNVTTPGLPGSEAWQEQQRQQKIALEGNAASLADYYRERILIDTYGLEPPGAFAGSCYSWNWHWLLAAAPTRVVELTPGIVAASYGYEG